MKQYKSFIVALAALAVGSCADDKFQQYQTAAPERNAQYAYLNDYADLKTYKNPNASSAFKLGGAMEASDFMKGEQYYALAAANFDEIVAGNAMKMGSCVTEKGVFDYAAVTSFVNTATDAGLDVYGHTLAWHSQQPVKWLNSLIADKELDVDPNAMIEEVQYELDWTTRTAHGMFAGGDCAGHLTIGADGLMVNSVKVDPWYGFQYFAADGMSLFAGKNYILRLEIKGSPDSESLHYVLGPWGTDIKVGTIGFTSEWTTVDIPVLTDKDFGSVHLLLQSGDYEGDYAVRKVQLISLEAPAQEVEVEVYAKDWSKATGYDGMWNGGDCNGHLSVSADGLKVNSVKVDPWYGFQFFIANGIELKSGSKYVAHITMKGSPNNDNLHYIIGPWGTDVKGGTISFTSDWTTVDIPFIPSADVSGVHIMLQSGDYAGDYIIKNVTVCEFVKMNTIPLTDEEKKDTLTWAMDKWISGMMEACEGKVKAWDVVNEAISGGDPDAEGIFALHHADDGCNNGKGHVADDEFVWQDYLGDLDYVRTAVKLARQDGPEDIKWFINDYNLESDWDNNQKLKSLIAWIKRWEDDGVTKIDGIGTQMHISCYEDQTVQANKKAAIENMLKLMVASGKLVRISELDMGYVDANNKKLNTADLTEEQHKQMAELYNWIIQTYFDIVPADQQWGICQWCITDSPSNSGWRPNEPVGLWDQNFYRKHVYGGFATGLAGKPYEPGK